jgi:hypothetical protein
MTDQQRISLDTDFPSPFSEPIKRKTYTSLFEFVCGSLSPDYRSICILPKTHDVELQFLFMTEHRVRNISFLFKDRKWSIVIE